MSPGRSRRRLASIEWMDRQGNFTPLRETPGDYYAPALSPDGKRLALAINDGKRIDIWVYELAHDTLTRLTFAGNNLTPIWTPDGQRITYRSLQKGGGSDLYWTRADGTGGTLRLTHTKARRFLGSWHPDGRLLAFDQGTSANSTIFTLAIGGSEKDGLEARRAPAAAGRHFVGGCGLVLAGWPLARLPVRRIGRL